MVKWITVVKTVMEVSGTQSRLLLRMGIEDNFKLFDAGNENEAFNPLQSYMKRRIGTQR